MARRTNAIKKGRMNLSEQRNSQYMNIVYFSWAHDNGNTQKIRALSIGQMTTK